ncbi:hypothetical protein [Cupriavidus sp.]|uniref:hypothetical protein n=1 Tax=Cupriavidus sp. TaxID=1873897 RepID=UPI0028BD8CBE|nr:hypothetical protein [Cupriavidus sp.]
MRVAVLSYARAAMLAAMVLLMGMAGPAGAVPPSFVYRGTATLSPDEVFAHGIPNAGTNDDLYDHVNGGSCSRGDTAFVPTSASETFAYERAMYALITNPAATFYVYRIRAAGNFYSADASLRAAYRATGDQRYLSTANHFQHQEEWLAFHGVQANQVESVVAYRRNAQTLQIEQVESRRNPNYIAANTRGNEAIFVARPPRGNIRVLRPSFRYSHVSACFGCFPQQRSARSVDGASTAQCEFFSVPINDKKVTVIDPIVGDRTQRFVPWTTRNTKRNAATTTGPAACVITPGSPLTVDCSRFRHADKFSVALRAGGSANTWVDTSFSGGDVLTGWARTSGQIPVSNTTRTLGSYGYSTSTVFSGFDKSWWSEVTVIPVYPRLPKNPVPICLYRGNGFQDRLDCVPAGGEWPTMQGAANDATSSIDAPAGQRYQVCEHFEFKGRCSFLIGRADTVDLNRIGMNSTISSIRVCRKPVPNTWRAPPDNRGVIGDIYAYDNPSTGAREYFRLNKTTYGQFYPGWISHAEEWTRLPGYQEC